MKLLEEIHSNWNVATEMQKLQARIWSQATGGHQKVILVSSPFRGEGKSTTVACLGVMLALNPTRKVLIADLDLRGPQQHAFFEIEPVPGVAEVVRGEHELEAAIGKTEFEGLEVLAAGDSKNPPEILNSPRLMAVFSAVRARYDIVLVDTPAMIPVADASALMGLADGIILVVMSGRTPKAGLAKARELCLGMKVDILGLVVGNAEEATPELYSSRDYYQYEERNGKKK